jgi:hypothetical protein
MEETSLLLFDDRFLESYAGNSLLTDPKTAIMELLANSWDAGATEVEIIWPDEETGDFFIIDNGHGMTYNMFIKIWRTLSYNRLYEQGSYAYFENDLGINYKRPAFGRNGKGRFAAFCFGNSYYVKTWREGEENLFEVRHEVDNPLVIKFLEKNRREGHGTEIFTNYSFNGIPSHTIRSEIGMRFLTDPNFSVKVNNQKVSFFDIPKDNIEEIVIHVNEKDEVIIKVIDIKDTDRTTHLHGIAWRVKNRLVGECTWKGSDQEALVDGRRINAKRYTFMVFADALDSCVLPDWSGFKTTDPSFIETNNIVQSKIKDYLLGLTKESRESRLKELKIEHKNIIKRMSPISYERWEMFVKRTQEECPSISESDLIKLSGLLANLEASNNQYNLIHILHELSPDQLDNLDKILAEWNIDMAKIVLDELQFRLKLLEELKIKIQDPSTDELHELQPLFYRGLWIFGPEYETIEYTSNEGMTTVIYKIFNKNIKASKKRPDFVILPDSTVGLYSYPKYDENGSEIGVDKLTIVELKKPGINISSNEKSQCWEYIKELNKIGLLDRSSIVNCFVLGSKIDPLESSPTLYNEYVRVIPLTYSIIVERAKSRLLKLADKVQRAPFLSNFRLEPTALNDEQQYEIKLNSSL